MKAIFSSKSYWIISILATTAIFMALANFGKIYQSEVDILILPKNPTLENNSGLIAENAIQISRTLSFYEAILRNNPSIKDMVSNLSAKQRKNFWQKEIQADKLANSGAVKFIIFDKDPQTAENFSQAIFPVLVQEMEKYYSADTAIDIKIIDGPLPIQLAIKSYKNYAFSSLLISFIAVFLSFLLSDALIKTKKEEALFTLPAKKLNLNSPTLNSQVPNSQTLTPEEARQRLSQLLRGKI